MQELHLLIHNELYKTLPIYYFTNQECKELGITQTGEAYVRIISLVSVSKKWRKRFRKIFSKAADVGSAKYRADEPKSIKFVLSTTALPVLNHPGGLMVTVYQARRILSTMSFLAGIKLAFLLNETERKLRYYKQVKEIID
jgi:hypothetical protein